MERGDEDKEQGTEPEGEVLELRDEGGGRLRHYLAGEPVHAGDLLEIRREDGQGWQRVRYEWNPRAGEERPFFHRSETDIFPLPLSGARFRWPPSGLGRHRLR